MYFPLLSDPLVNGVPLAAEVGCTVPYSKDPYAVKSTANRQYNMHRVLLYELIMCFGLMVVFLS